ncbi:TPA: hypothetical protein ACGR77_002689 [Pseudomonas aeruginosa]
MSILKNAIAAILGDKDKIEMEWHGVGQRGSSLGLSLDGFVSDFKEISNTNFPDSKNAYLKLCRKATEFKEHLKNLITNNKDFQNQIEKIANESGHTIKSNSWGIQIENSNGPFINVDTSGNIEFITKNISSPALERYIDAVTSKFKENEAFIVFKGGDKYSDTDNKELLRIITKSMIANDIDFKRLHLADSKYQSIVDEMTPVPLRVELFDGKYIKSDKPYIFNPKDSEAVLAHRGLNLIKYSGGDKEAFKKYKEIYQQAHKIDVELFENSEIIKFTAIDTGHTVSFRTASIREGGARLKEELQNESDVPFNDTGLNKNKPYNPEPTNPEPTEQVKKKSRGLNHA